MKLNFKWKRKTGQFSNGEALYLNRIRLGGYDWNFARGRTEDENTKYVGELDLPSLMTRRLYASDVTEMKTKLEKQAQAWFDETALKEIEEG